MFYRTTALWGVNNRIWVPAPGKMALLRAVSHLLLFMIQQNCVREAAMRKMVAASVAVDCFLYEKA